MSLHAAAPIASEARDVTARPYAGRHRAQPDPDPERCPSCGHPYGACECQCCYDDHAGLVPDGIGWGHE